MTGSWRSSSTGSWRTTASSRRGSRPRVTPSAPRLTPKRSAHLIEAHYDDDLTDAVVRPTRSSRATSLRRHPPRPPRPARGRAVPDTLVVGLGKQENFLASQRAAFLGETRNVIFPDDGDIVSITPDASSSSAPTDSPSTTRLSSSTGTTRAPRRAATRPSCSRRSTTAGVDRRDDRRPHRHGSSCSRASVWTYQQLADLRRIVILACGTAYHAGVVGRYVIEEWARSRSSRTSPASGSTATRCYRRTRSRSGSRSRARPRDTVDAMRLAREMGAHTLAITNMMGSQITREVDSTSLHALRPRGRRRRVEDVHGAGRAALPDRAEARRDARDAAAERDPLHRRRGLRRCPRRSRRSSTATTRSRRSPSASTTSRSSSTSAATSGFPSRSRAR